MLAMLCCLCSSFRLLVSWRQKFVVSNSFLFTGNQCLLNELKRLGCQTAFHHLSCLIYQMCGLCFRSWASVCVCTCLCLRQLWQPCSLRSAGVTGVSPKPSCTCSRLPVTSNMRLFGKSLLKAVMSKTLVRQCRGQVGGGAWEAAGSQHLGLGAL